MAKKNIERNLQVTINQGYSNEKNIWRRRFTAFNTYVIYLSFTVSF